VLHRKKPERFALSAEARGTACSASQESSTNFYSKIDFVALGIRARVRSQRVYGFAKGETKIRVAYPFPIMNKEKRKKIRT